MKNLLPPNPWETLERIKETLSLSHEDMADRMGLTYKSYSRLRSMQGELKVTSVFNFADSLNIGFTPLMTGDVDYIALAKHFLGNNTYLPEKYQAAAFSKRRTTLSMLNHIEKDFGWRERSYVLKHFQLNESMFADPDQTISFNFGSDLCEYLLKYKYGEHGLEQMGVQSLKAIDLSHVKAELLKVKNVGEIFIRMTEEMLPLYFEKNFIYRVTKMSRSGCTVSSVPNPQALDQFRTKKIGNHATAVAKRGIIAAWPSIVGLPVSHLRQVACIYHGSSEMRFEINFENSLRAFHSPMVHH